LGFLKRCIELARATQASPKRVGRRGYYQPITAILTAMVWPLRLLLRYTFNGCPTLQAGPFELGIRAGLSAGTVPVVAFNRVRETISKKILYGTRYRTRVLWVGAAIVRLVTGWQSRRMSRYSVNVAIGSSAWGLDPRIALALSCVSVAAVGVDVLEVDHRLRSEQHFV